MAAPHFGHEVGIGSLFIHPLTEEPTGRGYNKSEPSNQESSGYCLLGNALRESFRSFYRLPNPSDLGFDDLAELDVSRLKKVELVGLI